jgi:processive 1,2-diacylglycerol beta-glucosyltransferase
VERPFQSVVVTGRNEELRRELAAQDRKHPTHVLGFVTNMHELMAVADLLITKPGGLTSSEALAMGKPLLILNPIPGQEAANSDFLLERGAAAKVNRVEDLPYRTEQLLGTKKLAEMARATKALGRPNAAPDICREVVKRAAPAVYDRLDEVKRGGGSLGKLKYWRLAGQRTEFQAPGIGWRGGGRKAKAESGKLIGTNP